MTAPGSLGSNIIELAVRALADTYAEKASPGAAGEDQLRSMVEQATRSLKGRIDLPPEDLNALIEAVGSRPSYSAGFEYSRRQVARWFEVALDEFDQTPMSSLSADVMFRHMYYENKLSAWFTEFGYTVQIGEELEGLEGADFIPDVYAELSTLHGNFQVAVTLFCGNPPNTWRVLGMLENIEAFAPKGSEFGERDIYLMVTPFKFLEQASNHIRIQSHQEDYFVIALEGNDLQDLEHAADSVGRKERLQDLVLSVARARSSAF
jgi:hypothetical protein